MNTDIPLALHDLVILDAIPLDLWQELLRTCHFGSERIDEITSHEAVADLLNRGEPPDAFLKALQLVHDLGTDNGREAIIKAADDRNADLARWLGEADPCVFALRLWLARDEKIEGILVRCQLAAMRATEPRTFCEFAGAERSGIRCLATARHALEGAIAQWCAQNERGDYSEVRAFSDGSVTRFQVLHAHRIQTPVVVEKRKRKVIQIAPAQCEVLEYDADTGRLRIAARSQVLARALTAIFGQVLFNDPTFFAGESTCSFASIQRLGQAALDRHRLDNVIASARIVECLLDRRDGRKLWLASRDCLEDLQEMHVSREEVGWIEAKIEIRFRAGRPSTTLVKVGPGNHIGFRHDLREADIERFLERVEIRLPDDPGGREDLWALRPWHWPRGRWTRLVGLPVDEMVSAKILLSKPLACIPHPDFPAAGPVLDVQWIEEGGQRVPYGISTDEGVPSRSLTSSDVEGLELDIDRLARRMAHDLGLSGHVGPLGPEGTISLGERSLGGQVVRVLFVTRDPTAAPVSSWGSLHAATPALNVLLVPAGRRIEASMLYVEISSIAPPFDDLLLPIVRALNLTAQLSPAERRRRNTDLFIDTKTATVLLYGEVLNTLSPDTEVFKLLVCLARAAPGPVHASKIASALGIRPSDAVDRVRDIKRDLREKIQAWLKARNRPLADAKAMLPPSRGAQHVLKLVAQVE